MPRTNRGVTVNGGSTAHPVELNAFGHELIRVPNNEDVGFTTVSLATLRALNIPVHYLPTPGEDSAPDLGETEAAKAESPAGTRADAALRFLDAVEEFKEWKGGGALELNGVRIETCDEFGSTATTRLVESLRAHLESGLESKPVEIDRVTLIARILRRWGGSGEDDLEVIREALSEDYRLSVKAADEALDLLEEVQRG